MKTLLSLALMAVIGAFAYPTGAKADEMVKDTMTAKPKIVAFHADNCGACKALAPKLESAMTQLEDSVEFVKFDYTSKETIKASKALASEKGLAELQKEHGAKTGYALLVKADGTVAEKFTRKSDVTDIVSAAQKATMTN